MPVSPTNFDPSNKAKDKFHNWPVLPYPKDTAKRDLELRSAAFIITTEIKLPKHPRTDTGKLRVGGLTRQIYTFCQNTTRPMSAREIYKQFLDKENSEHKIANRLSFLVKQGYLRRPVAKFYEVCDDKK